MGFLRSVTESFTHRGHFMHSMEGQEQEVLNRLTKYGLGGRAAVDTRFDNELKQALHQKSWRACMTGFVTSRFLQGLIMVLIHVNLLVAWLEVDTEETDDIYPYVWVASYTLTVLFFIESLLHMIFLPKWWEFKDVAIDLLFCIIVFVGETLSLLQVVEQGVKYLTVLRCLRILRFAWKLRTRNSGRPLRILISSLERCSWNFLWVAALLLMSFYLPALLARTVFEAPKEEKMQQLVDTYFSTAPMAFVTFMQMFFGNFDYYDAVIWPLLHSDEFWWVGIILIIYGIFMYICIANCVMGLFVESIMLTARQSDDNIDKEMLSMRERNYQDLLKIFKQIDRRGCGFFNYQDWIHALESSPQIEQVLEVITGRPHDSLLPMELQNFGHDVDELDKRLQARDRNMFFKNLDIIGSGEISFADFVYGILKNTCHLSSLEQLIFDHQFSKIVKLSSQTCRSTREVKKYMQAHAESVMQITTQLREHEIGHSSDLLHIRKHMTSLQEYLDHLAKGLNEFDPRTGARRQVLTVDQSRQAYEMNNVMRGLIEQVQSATGAARQQAAATRKVLSDVSRDFHSEALSLSNGQLEAIKSSSVEARRAAAAAAEGTKATCAKLANAPLPSRSDLTSASPGEKSPT